jgi:hypothetical protein
MRNVSAFIARVVRAEATRMAMSWSASLVRGLGTRQGELVQECLRSAFPFPFSVPYSSFSVGLSAHQRGM